MTVPYNFDRKPPFSNEEGDSCWYSVSELGACSPLRFTAKSAEKAQTRREGFVYLKSLQRTSVYLESHRLWGFPRKRGVSYFSSTLAFSAPGSGCRPRQP